MIATLRLYREGRHGSSVGLLFGTCGCPIVPAKGDIVDVGEEQFLVTAIRWDLKLQTVTVAADLVVIP